MKRAISILTELFLTTVLMAGNGLGLRSVVIDPGHGGKDAGAVSKDKKSYEKTFTLDISKKLASLINEAYPDVKVTLTRSTDQFISLQERAVTANKADAQLFISIHINATPQTVANGYSVHVLGQSSNKDRDLFAYNMDVCKRENSVIMLEEDYSTKYEGFDPNDTESYIFMTLMQNANLEQSMKFAQDVQKSLKGGPIRADRGLWQNPFYVLWKTSMPAVLLELGFISNEGDLASLRDPAKRTELARRVFNAFSEYKKSYDSTVGSQMLPSGLETEQKSGDISEPAPVVEDSSTLYGVQVIVTSHELNPKSEILMGYEPKVFRTGTIRKYVIAVSSNLDEVRNKLPQIRKKSPDAFIVKLGENSIERVK